MLAKTPIGTRFYRWVAAQPPDGKYLATCSTGCACGRFMQEELGASYTDTTCSFLNHWDEVMGVDPSYSGVDPVLVEVWQQFNEIATSGDSTFGALRKRIEKRMPEVVA